MIFETPPIKSGEFVILAGGDPKLARERPLIQTSNFSKDPQFDQMSKHEGFYSFGLDWDEWAQNYQQVHQILSRSFEMVVTKVSLFPSF